jgi:hypothetical protein
VRVKESYSIPEKLIVPLLSLYEYESRTVNSGLNVGRDFSLEWTQKDLIEIVEDAGGSAAEAIELLDVLDRTKRVVRFYHDGGGEGVRAYRTDTAELVRLSTFNYNRYPSKTNSEMVSTQCGVTWSIESKMTPKWSMTINEVATTLTAEITQGWTDDSGKSQSYNQGELIKAVTIVAAAYNAVQQKRFGTDGSLSGYSCRYRFRKILWISNR